ncbi:MULTISPECIES: hypothetical protein [unclassified Clostridium]|uniref:hypothetical protein n=1 Tax=unclassified Clostridium TaxID=2614128 RepID=UPI0005533BDF|nr:MULTISPECIES: hypothetical protein [unclassified Clostridium]
MQKDKVLTFTKVLCISVVIGAIISLFIVLKDIDNSIALSFLKAYVFLVFFINVYIPIITIYNMRKLKWNEIKNRLFRFITILIIFSVLSIYRYYTKSLSLDTELFKELIFPLVLSFYITFFDIVFLRRRKN